MTKVVRKVGSIPSSTGYGVEVSIDILAGFAYVIRKVFPNARIVYDRFHVMQKVIKEFDRIRRQSRITDKGAKRLILKNRKDLNEEEKAKLDSY
ncbi:MAG: transposase [Synechococcaceae cyanobacterium SM2_3_1]|nr:transposase [Synechococcaceae cyanobacterium SM2_3_1]